MNFNLTKKKVVGEFDTIFIIYVIRDNYKFFEMFKQLQSVYCDRHN